MYHEVNSILTRIGNPSIFLHSWSINDVTLIENYCQQIYFPTEPPSLGLLTSTYGILYFVVKEFRLTHHPLCKTLDLQAYESKCEQNFYAGIETYDILGHPSFENILALTIGVSLTISKILGPWLSSSLTMCSILYLPTGY